MALIVITINDSEEGAQVGVLAEPRLPVDPEPMSPAQGAALLMLQTLRAEIKEDHGLLKLLS